MGGRKGKKGAGERGTEEGERGEEGISEPQQGEIEGGYTYEGE